MIMDVNPVVGKIMKFDGTSYHKDCCNARMWKLQSVIFNNNPLHDFNMNNIFHHPNIGKTNISPIMPSTSLKGNIDVLINHIQQKFEHGTKIKKFPKIKIKGNEYMKFDY
jgi:hypothetical protein